MTVKDILHELEELAPTGLAMEWDNAGLQLGREDWSADKILLTLDVTPSVIAYAIRHSFDLIVSHHPLIFRPIKSITQSAILDLVQHQIAVISMHTNLDVVPQGVNSALAEALGLANTHLLSDETGAKWYHCSVTVPPSAADKLLNAIQNAGGGRIGCYDMCSTRHEIKGSFRPLEGSNPFLGKAGKYEQTDEIELEFMVDSFNLEAVKRAIKSAHPYEEPAVYFVETRNNNPAYGLGLAGELEKEVSLFEFAERVKTKLQAPFVQLWTAGSGKNYPVKKIGVCGGAGASLIKTASGQVDVLVTGDINYHTMLESALPLINAGHFYTEYPVLKKLHNLLKAKKIDSFVYPVRNHEIRNNLLI